MLNLLDKCYIGMMARLNRLVHDEEGAVDIVAIVVLIGIVVLIAIVFRERLAEIIKNLFDGIDQDVKQTRYQIPPH